MTRELPCELAGCRVVVLTTFEMDEYVFRSLRAGASGFLSKDIDPEELRRAVRVVAEGNGTFYNQPMAAGSIYTVAGHANTGSVGDGGSATTAELNSPAGLLLDAPGNTLIADAADNRIRVLAATHQVNRVAALAVAAAEIITFGKSYMEQIVRNARALGAALLATCSGGSRNRPFGRARGFECGRIAGSSTRENRGRRHPISRGAAARESLRRQGARKLRRRDDRRADYQPG